MYHIYAIEYYSPLREVRIFMSQQKKTFINMNFIKYEHYKMHLLEMATPNSIKLSEPAAFDVRVRKVSVLIVISLQLWLLGLRRGGGRNFLFGYSTEPSCVKSNSARV